MSAPLILPKKAIQKTHEVCSRKDSNYQFVLFVYFKFSFIYLTHLLNFMNKHLSIDISLSALTGISMHSYEVNNIQ